MNDNTEALPPLPEPRVKSEHGAGWFTAGQMHTYARAALAQRQQVPEGWSELVAAAQAVVERWDTPVWKQAQHTGEYINRLRAALTAAPSAQAEPVAKAPAGCYPEEWGPSSDRRLTCACGNPDPSHWEKK